MASETRIGARARVTLTVEIDAPDTWGDYCTVAQVHRQATDWALLYASKLLEGQARLVGTPTVSMITTEKR